MTTIAEPVQGVQRAPWAKQRILETADELFYLEGIRVVGVDRLISVSSVTKATFYKHYGSKDKLIITYIAGRHESMSAATLQLVEAAASPQDALHEIVAQLTATIRGDGFRGCVFSNAAAEFPDPAHPVRAIVTKHRDWQSELISSLLSEIGHPMAGDAADEFVLAIDGAHVGGYAGDPIAATTAFERTTDRVIGEAIHA